MAKKNIILGSLLLLMVAIIIALVSSSVLSTIQKKLDVTGSSSQSQKQTRGWTVDSEKNTIYQFPVTVLGDIRTEDELYKVKVSPFNSPAEEFDLYVGSPNTKFSYGTCEFDGKGEILSNVTWTLLPIEQVIKDFRIGDTLLIRLTYPINPVNDQIRYKEELLKQIDNLEQKKQIEFMFPAALCKST